MAALLHLQSGVRCLIGLPSVNPPVGSDPHSGRSIVRRRSPRTHQSLRHPYNLPESIADDPQSRGNRRDPHPSSCGIPAVRTRCRITDERGGLRGSASEHRSHTVHLTTCSKGRVERNFGTAQDRLVKGMRVAGVKTIEQANQYLEETYLVWWERELTVEPAHSDDAHRPLDKSHNLAEALSHVETRQVRNDYTIPLDADLYQIERQAVVSGLRKANVRVEKRLDGY